MTSGVNILLPSIYQHIGILYLFVPLSGDQSSTCGAWWGIHVSWSVCASCNIWTLQEATKLMLKAKIIQELARNFLKGNISMCITAIVKLSPHELSSVQCRAEKEVVSVMNQWMRVSQFPDNFSAAPASAGFLLSLILDPEDGGNMFL
jgi:hypothetical protein